MMQRLIYLLAILAAASANSFAQDGAASSASDVAARPMSQPELVPPRLLPQHPFAPAQLFALPPGAERLPAVSIETVRPAKSARGVANNSVQLVAHEEPASEAKPYGYDQSFDTYYQSTAALYNASDDDRSQRQLQLLGAGHDPNDDYGVLPASGQRRSDNRRRFAEPPPAAQYLQSETEYDARPNVQTERAVVPASSTETVRMARAANRNYSRDYEGEVDETYNDRRLAPVGCDLICDGSCGGYCDECEAAAGEACDICYETDGLEELQGVYFRAELLVLTRERAVRDQPLVVQGIGQTAVLSANDLEFDWEVGPRAVAGFNLNDRTAIELTYFGTHHWQTQAVVNGPGDLAIPGDLALASFDFLDADRMRIDYSADLHSGEGNLVYRLGFVDFFGGARFFSLDEQLNINGLDNGFGSGDYNIRVSNDLYGGQIGGAIVQEYKRWGFDAFCKAGAYSNSVDHRQTVGDFNNQITLRDVHTYESDVAFVGEAALHLAIFLSERVSLRGGYHVLWADGVALAPNQLDFTDTATSGTAIDVESTLFLHGVTGGLEVIW